MSKVSISKAVSEPRLFAPPPLLEGEDAAAYDELYGRVCAAVKPVDVIDEMLIVDFVVLELDILRWRRWKSNRIRERGLEALNDFCARSLITSTTGNGLPTISRTFFEAIFQNTRLKIMPRCWPAPVPRVSRLLSTKLTKSSTALVTAWITC